MTAVFPRRRGVGVRILFCKERIMLKRHRWMMALAAIGLFGSCVAAEFVDPATLKSSASEAKAEVAMIISTATGLDSVNHFIAWKAKHLLEEKSGGRIYASVYEAGALGGDRENIEGLQNGTVDFFVTVSSAYVPFAPKTGIFDLPNALPTLEIGRKALDSRILDMVRPDYEAAGFKFYGFSDAGFRQTTSSRPVRSMEDFKGLKIRTMENPNHMAYWSALGANPTPMDFSELYISLQQGAIDAQENPYDLIVANKLYEPQKYMIETNHLMHTLTMNGSKLKYDALPGDLKPIVDAAIREALDYGRAAADARIESRKKIVTDHGCEILTVSPEFRRQMLSRLDGVYARIRKDVGSELVDAYLSIIAELEKQ